MRPLATFVMDSTCMWLNLKTNWWQGHAWSLRFAPAAQPMSCWMESSLLLGSLECLLAKQDLQAGPDSPEHPRSHVGPLALLHQWAGRHEHRPPIHPWVSTLT
ncbi:unnamed protein product [Durusdinium trenchii]|uniref:Uncharacterized protein n=1 Tax=Durusdinium trenchii TaxID=1381693 RepID=A0ABP0Q1W3_9DINO